MLDQCAVFQDVMQPHFTRVVEDELRREVVAFMSTAHHDPDISAELFVLAPERSADGAMTGARMTTPGRRRRGPAAGVTRRA